MFKIGLPRADNLFPVLRVREGKQEPFPAHSEIVEIIPERLNITFVDKVVRAIGIDDGNGERGILCNIRKEFFALFKGFLCTLAFGDVPEDPFNTEHCTEFVVIQVTVCGNIERGSIFPLQDDLVIRNRTTPVEIIKEFFSLCRNRLEHLCDILPDTFFY